MGTIPFFNAIGWGQWFRYASGALDTSGALFIFVPRCTSLGALIITCTVGLGTFLCLTKALYNPSFPMVMTLLAATLVRLAWRAENGLRGLRALSPRAWCMVASPRTRSDSAVRLTNKK